MTVKTKLNPSKAMASNDKQPKRKRKAERAFRKPVFEWPIAETKRQAAELLRWPVALLTQFQKAGCPGFNHGRVYLGDVIPWIGQRTDDAGIDWSKEWKKTQTLREQIKLGEDQQLTVSRPSVVEGVNGGLALLFSELDRLFCSELPPDLKGRTEIEVRNRCAAEIENLKAALRLKFGPLTKRAEEE